MGQYSKSLQYTKLQIKKIKKAIDSLVKNHQEPEDLSLELYIWIVFSYNIYHQTKDIITLFQKHRLIYRNKNQTAIYSIFRSILEDYFFLKSLLSKKYIKEKFKAFEIVKTHLEDKKMFNSLINLYREGKFIPSTDPENITSLISMQQRVFNADKEIAKFNSNSIINYYINIYKNIEEVCKNYDEENNISSVSASSECLSLAWLYQYIYRFLSQFTHQSLYAKEEVIAELWRGKAYKGKNIETILLLNLMLDDIYNLRIIQKNVAGN